jgi:hypothetical protein
MGDSVRASGWKIIDAPKKIAALNPQLPTYNRSFALGAANMIWYKDPILLCRDRCKLNVSLLFPSQTPDTNMIGVVGFKFGSTND